jgi:hypothetical protein
MDQFQKSHSFYDTTNGEDEYSITKPSMNHSQSFALGYNNNYSYNDYSEQKSSSHQVEQFQKSFSYYDKTNGEDEFLASKPTMNNSQSFAFGTNNYDSFHDFSDLKSTINQFVKQDPIKEEAYETSNIVVLSFNIY